MNKLKKYITLAKNELKQKITLAVLLLILANLIGFSYPALADFEADNNNLNFNYKLAENDQIKDLIKIINPEVLFWGNTDEEDKHLPENNGLKVKYSKSIRVTAYNSEVGQCDDSPCVTANGFNVCEHGKEDTIAVNGMKFGTRVRFPDLFGNRVFVVRDRMNARYDSNQVDVWMISKADAKKFGAKRVAMEVLE